MSAMTRTYRGRAIEQLIGRMRKDLGAEAVVVRRSEGRTRGVLGMFQRNYVEIEAMPPPEGTPQGNEGAPRIRAVPIARAPHEPAARAAGSGESAYVTAYLASLAKLGTQSAMPGGILQEPERSPLAHAPPPEPAVAPGPAGRPVQPAPPPPAPAPSARQGQTQAPQPMAAALAASPAGAAAPDAAPEDPSASARRSFERARQAVEKPLLRRGLGVAFVHELTETAAAHVLPLAPRAGLAQAVRGLLAQRIPAASALPASGGSIAVVGAGGAGKTAVCASLLAAYRSASTLPARCATILRPDEDADELALLLSPDLLQPVPIDSPRALRAVRRASEGGFMVFDTPAVSPADRGSVRALARALVELAPSRVLIALPATLGLGAAEQLLAGLAPLNPAGIALTHADETDQIGVGVEAACRFSLAPELLLERGAARGWRLHRLDAAALVARLLD